MTSHAGNHLILFCLRLPMTFLSLSCLSSWQVRGLLICYVSVVLLFIICYLLFLELVSCLRLVLGLVSLTATGYHSDIWWWRVTVTHGRQRAELLPAANHILLSLYPYIGSFSHRAPWIWIFYVVWFNRLRCGSRWTIGVSMCFVVVLCVVCCVLLCCVV